MGRFDSLHFDSDGEPCTLTRIPREACTSTEGRNLVTGGPIAQVTLDAFSKFFAVPSGEG
jgi:hypothetical protein